MNALNRPYSVVNAYTGERIEWTTWTDRTSFLLIFKKGFL